MFTDRIKEDRAFAAAKPGLLDAWLSGWRDSRFARIVAEAGQQ